MYDIVSLGELLVDFTQSGVSDTGMRLFEQNAGGAVTNLLAAAARQGRRTAFIGKVGRDMHGAFLKNAVDRAGVDTRGLIEDDTVFTTLAFVALDAGTGERAFSFARKPGADTRLTAEELDRGLLEHTRIFHHGSLSCTDEPANTATREAIRIARSAGALISYDPNYRASLWDNRGTAVEVMRSLLDTADFVKISDEEAVLLTGEEDPALAARAILGRGVRVAAVTLGGDGALVAVRDGTRHVPGFRANAVDTTGAGDAFFGGFLTAFLDGQKSIDALTVDDAAAYARVGNATASLCVEHRGAIPAMPTRQEVEERLKRGSV